MRIFDFIEGTAPLLISMPHCGTWLPPFEAGSMTPQAYHVADTDWHLDRLYDFAQALGASIIRPNISRYVIDLNRPPDNAELYPGANGTDLCPVNNFASQDLYLDDEVPNESEIDRRLDKYWRPYHQKLEKELARLKKAHGVAVLFEAHSIRSVVPRLFEGKLPDINIGTAGGSSCAASLLSAVEQMLASQQDYSHVTNQRFKGGYITRAYGKPETGIHSMQLELSQCTYMQEKLPFRYLPEKAAEVQPLLKQLVQTLITWAQQQGRSND